MDKDQLAIEKYLDGQMTATERAAFTERLASDRQLAEAVDAERASRQLIKIGGRQKLREQLAQLDQQLEAQTVPMQRTTWHRPLLVAASVLLLLSIAWWLWPTSAVEPTQLFADYYETYRGPVQLRGDNSSLTTPWTQACKYYEEQNYAAAAAAFEQALGGGAAPDNQIQFYLGQSLLAQKPPRSTAAIQAFQQVRQSQNDFQAPALWYQSLAALQLGQTEQAKTLLETLQTESDYQKEAVQAVLALLD